MRQSNEPRVSNRDEIGRWMCEAHNAVNVKLGKESFDCNRWEERWRTGSIRAFTNLTYLSTPVNTGHLPHR